MNITISDEIGLSPEHTINLAKSLIQNRPPNNSFRYGLETHTISFKGFDGLYPIEVYQIGERKSEKSPLRIKIKPHITL